MIKTRPSGIPVARLFLAHGAGAGMESEFLSTLADALSNQKIEVIRFNFPYMARIVATGVRRPPEAIGKLVASYADIVSSVHEDGLPLFVAGKSLGGRVATCLSASHLPEGQENPVLAMIQGVFCYGYPLHPPGKPEKLRVGPLQASCRPVCILQGQRDPFGRPSEFLSLFGGHSHIHLVEVADGDHDYKPLKKSPVSQRDNIQFAASETARHILFWQNRKKNAEHL